jgi:hypothetical protein
MKIGKKLKKNIVIAFMVFTQQLFLQSQLIPSLREQAQQIHKEESKNSLCYKSIDSKANYYKDIAPEKLEGLDLKEVFRMVIEYTYETNRFHELPQGLINCCKALENDATSLYMPDLMEALPMVIEKMGDPALQQIWLRAPRIDSPGNDGTFVGPVLNCNFNQAVQLLNKLLKNINACCGQLKFDFNGVFTALSSLIASATCDFTTVFSLLNTSFSGTFTELNDINNTLTTCCAALELDFNGTFSVLSNLVTTATCDFTVVFSILNTNFSGTFTELNDIKNTLTTCCGALEFNFDGTFTVIADLIANATCDFTSVFSIIITNFNGTFSVLDDIKNSLTTCCAALESDFDGTFTVISSLMATASCDFTVAFSIITTNFNGTFSVLDDIKDSLILCCTTLQSDFDGTFTVLTSLETATTCNFMPLVTAITTNFNGTFSAFEDIKSTLTACCATSEANFNGTFTVLANLVITATCDFTPVFTVLRDIKDTLTICCSQTEFDFNGAFTAFSHIVATVTCDFTPLFTALNDIKSTLTTCCNNFNGTFTVLNDIKNTLTTCCTQLEFDSGGTFTVIARLSSALCDVKQVFTIVNDIKNTLTICCAQLEFDFDGTFTALAHLTITGTFVDLASVFTLSNDIKNTLTICCAQIQNDFDGTFTVFADIKNRVLNFNTTFTVLDVLTAAICDPTVISQSNFGPGGTTPLIISAPGVYIFGENITFNPAAASQAIVITTSAVVLDLKCFTLQQGNSTAGVDAIRINSNLADVTVKNGIITNFTRAGITVQNNNLRTMIQNVTCLTCAVRGIELLSTVGNLIQDAEIDHCTINACAQGATGDFGILLQQGNRCKISYCDVINCGSLAHNFVPIRLDTCTLTSLNSINIINNSGVAVVAIQLAAPNRLSFENCVISSNSATANFTGVGNAGASNAFNMFKDCQIVRNSSGATFVGVNLPANSNNNMFINCNISWNNGQSVLVVPLAGGAAGNNQNSFINCILSANSSTTGSCIVFSINGSDAGFILNTEISYNTSTSSSAVGISFAGSGGNFWTIKQAQIISNTGSSPATSFGILDAAGANNFFAGNYGFANGGIGALPANQLNGVPAGSKVTPTAPATSDMVMVTQAFANANIAA